MNQLLHRTAVAGVEGRCPADADAEELRERLYGRLTGGCRAAQDFTAMHKQLSARKGRRCSLWGEYREAHPEGYGYTRTEFPQFTEYKVCSHLFERQFCQ